MNVSDIFDRLGSVLLGTTFVFSAHLLSFNSPSNAQSPLIFREQGTLQSGDDIMRDGSLFDIHLIEGQAGQEISIFLESNEFDTYLMVISPSGEFTAENNDAGDSTNSSVTIRLPESGVYGVVANAFSASGRGQYTITVRETQSANSTSLQQPQASTLSVEQQCNITLSEAINTIEDGRSIEVSIKRWNLSERYDYYPNGAPFGISIILEGRSTLDIMASIQFMSTISDKIITECLPIGLVQFAVYKTDYIESFAFVNGSLRRFECVYMDVEDVVPPDARWGEINCF